MSSALDHTLTPSVTALSPPLEVPSPPANRATRRFLALDALRGIAALAVVTYHVQGALDRGPQPWMPSLLHGLFHAGHFGVDIFFVLSGFVIAYSVRDGELTLGYLGRFALKRSLRLDPPYWVAIALEIGLIYFGRAVMPSLATPTPAPAQIAAHVFYLQELLGFRELMPNFWTLCYEVQFYLTLIVLLVTAQSLRRRVGKRVAATFIILTCATLFLTSITVHQGVLLGSPRGLAIDRWSEFFIGALAWWVVAGVAPWPLLPLAWLTDVLMAARPDSIIEMPIVVLVSSLCMLSAARPSLDRFFDWRPIQFLGAISYSLYLYHPSIGWRIVSLVQHFAGPSLSALVGTLTWCAAVGGAIVLAVLGWWCVERPSQRLSRRIKLPTRSAADYAPSLDVIGTLTTSG